MALRADHPVALILPEPLQLDYGSAKLLHSVPKRCPGCSRITAGTRSAHTLTLLHSVRNCYCLMPFRASNSVLGGATEPIRLQHLAAQFLHTGFELRPGPCW